MPSYTWLPPLQPQGGNKMKLVDSDSRKSFKNSENNEKETLSS